MKFFLIFILFFTSIIAYSSDEITAIHDEITTANSNESIKIYLNIKNSYLANEIFLNYKTGNAKNWIQTVVSPINGRFESEIPKINSKSLEIHYYISVITLEDETIDIFASKDNPQIIKLIQNKRGEELKTSKKEEVLDEVHDMDSIDDQEFLKNEFEVFQEDEEGVTVKLASGKKESLFDSPLSASVLTRKDIERSGATSIPEALRLIPGIIVREQTPGNYDVHLRGFDYIIPKSYLPFATNSTTLLMINNRILYNYINGGIYWEALPVDINDIERIEIVRGGASAMYGPNAASGVINIITRNFKDEQGTRSFSSINISKGDTTNFSDSSLGDATIINGITGYKKDKLSVIVSGNYSERKRTSTKYWGWRNGELDEDGNPVGGWVDDAGDLKSVDGQDQRMDDINFVTENQFPDQKLGIRRYGLNFYISRKINNNISFDLDLGGQNSDTQKAFQESLDSFLSGSNSSSQYLKFKTNIYNGEVQVSYKEGDEIAYNYPSFSYSSKVLNTKFKYDLNYKNLNIRPSISYNNIRYLGKGFGAEKPAEVKSENIGISTYMDYNYKNTLRLIAAGRIDKYAHNDKFIYTYQLASTVKIGKSGIIRAVYSRANRNPFLADIFFKVRNLNVDEPRVILGNPDHNPLIMDTMELGLRFKLNKLLNFNLEAFYVTGENYDDLAFTGDIVVVDGVSRAKVTFVNMELKSKQLGLSASLDLNVKILSLKLFGTIQKTDIENYNDNFLMNPNNPNLKNLSHKNTPKFYGGAYLNLKVNKKLNFNINPYFYSSQEFIHALGATKIDSKFILNAKVSYNLTEKMRIYFNGRNLLNNKTREFGYTDEIGGLYLLGVNIDY